MSRPVVHLASGEHAARTIGQAGLGAGAIVWRDMLHEGPVRDLAATALARERAAFFAAAGWGIESDIRAAFDARDRRLDEVLEADAELVLWFAPGVHDQLQRLQVLARVARCGRLRATVSEALPVDPPGLRGGTPLHAAFVQRQPVLAAAVARALEGWLAFTSDDAGRLDAFFEGDDAGSVLPDAAIRRWREEFPAADGGLSRTERQALAALDRGMFRARDVHVAACHHAEEVMFPADVPFASLLCRLSAGPQPLLAHPDQRPLAMPAHGAGASVFWNDSLLITRAGRERLAGIGDWMEQAPARWMGGVFLHGPAGWRWDPGANRMRCMAAR